MKTGIVYKTLLGSTRRYARWLSEEISADVYQMKEMKGERLGDYEVILIMSGTYIGFMPLIKYLKKNWAMLENKKVVAVAIGVAPPDDIWSQKSYNKIPEHIRNKIKYFKLPGRMGEKGKDNVIKDNLEPVIEYLRSERVVNSI